MDTANVLGFLVTLTLGLIPITIFSLPLLLRWLAEPEKDEDGKEKKGGKKEVLFLTVPEGRAKSVEYNEKFNHFRISYAGHEFAGMLPDATLEPDQAEFWEIVTYNHPARNYNLTEKLFNVPAYEGLHYMGLPYIARVPRYRFTWTEWAQKKDRDGKVSVEKEPIPHEEFIGHILVQPDVYFIQVAEAATKEGVPVTIRILLTIQVNNPYKARYRVQDWLEAVTNQAEADVRTFIATEEFLNILTVSAGNVQGVTAVTISTQSKAELEAMLSDGLKRYRNDYGVTVSLSQIQSAEPAGPEAAKYRALVTAEFEANAKAKQVTIAADADAYRIRAIADAEKEAVEKVLAAIAAIPDGEKLFRSQQIGRLQQLTTLVEGDSMSNRSRVVIPVGRP